MYDGTRSRKPILRNAPPMPSAQDDQPTLPAVCTREAVAPLRPPAVLSRASCGLQNHIDRWYELTIGRWLSEDPIGFVAGDENLYSNVGSSPINAVDPMGLWSITRKSQSPRAEAVPEKPEDTLRSLALEIGLSIDEVSKWLGLKVARGTNPILPQITESDYDVELPATCYLIPNTIVATWAVDDGKKGEKFTWDTDIAYLRKLGFHVVEASKETLLNTLSDLTSSEKRALHGVYLYAHGLPGALYNRKENATWRLSHSEAVAALQYKLGLGVFNVCHAMWDKKEAIKPSLLPPDCDPDNLPTGLEFDNRGVLVASAVGSDWINSEEVGGKPLGSPNKVMSSLIGKVLEGLKGNESDLLVDLQD